MLSKKCFLVGILTLLSVSLAIAAPPAVHPVTGEPLVIDCLRGTPDAIDGDLSDWNLEAMTPAVLDAAEQLYSGQDSWTGPEDCSGEVYLLWDDVKIYIAAVVKDEKLSMNKTGGDIWNADCVEVFFATTDARADHSWSNPTIHYQYGFNANNQKWNWCNMDGPGQSEPDYLQIAATETADGYICEASIEYGQMLSLDFSAGNTIGFHSSIDDTDIEDGDTELFMTWTGLAPHDQSMGFGHIVLSAEPPAALPEGWQSQDIGTTGGSAAESDGTWAISADGADVWGSADEFHYAYVPLSGNGTITARVVSNGEGSNGWAKGGVMIRETLDADSKHMIMALTGGEGGGIAFQGRHQETGANSSSMHGDITAAPPYWVKLTREGNTITGYCSADGIDWTLFTAASPDNAGGPISNPMDVEMAEDVYIGLFVTSHASGEIRTYTFDNVSVVKPTGYNIIWVSDFYDDDGDGVTDDIGWVELLEAQGHTVDYTMGDAVGNGYWRTLDDDKIAALNAADLIIVSRCSNSGDYADGDEVAQWNSVTTPIMLQAMHIVRNTRWRWLDTESVPNISDAVVEILAPDNPIFAGAASPVQVGDGLVGPTTYVDITGVGVGNGTLLAQVADMEVAWIVEWEAGVEFYPGSGQIAAGPRMVLAAGTQDEAGITGRGEYNLTPEGEAIFLNAVNSMLPAGPIAHWKLDEGSGTTVVDSTGNIPDGTFEGDPQWVVGKYGTALELDGDDWVNLGTPPDLVITDAISISCWVNPAGFVGRQGFVHLDAGYAFKVHEEGRLCFTTPGIADHESANTILAAGTWQHVAATFQPGQSEGLVFYLNGVETERMSSSAINPGTGPFRIGSNQWNETLTGLIDEILIYDRILSADEISQLAGNILANGGFENGVVEPWSTYGSATMEVVQELVGAAVPDAPIEGSYCLHVVVPEAGANFWDAGLQHAGHVFEAGKQYTLSAFLKCNQGTLDINFKPELGQDPWTGYGEQSFTMTEEWTEFSVTTPVFDADVSPATITFHIAYAPGDFWVDGVKFVEVQ